MFNRPNMYGRKVIYTDAEVIDESNVVDVLSKAIFLHQGNANDITYLYNYYRGLQPVLDRVKDIRPEINNKILVNRANEIVSFKVGYLLGDPVQYVNRGAREEASDPINTLNEYMFGEDKATKDIELATWFFIGGTGYRMVLADRNTNQDPDDAPFEIYTLDPRTTFVVYYSGLGNKPVMGVRYVYNREKGGIIYSVYTQNRYMEIIDNEIVKSEPHYYNDIPIIEYPANSARLGAFEIVLTLLDGINDAASDRLDGFDQFIQSLLVFKGVDITSEEFANLKEQGGLLVPPDGDVKYLVQELNQTQTRALTEDLYDDVLTICGMPNRNGTQRSTSDTGSAVIMRDGWWAAESRAKASEGIFDISEKQFLKIVLRICNAQRQMDLKLSDIEIRFTRRNYENIMEKAQVLTMMLANNQIHPRLAFAHSGMFADPEVAYQESMRYAEEKRREMEDELRKVREDQLEDDTNVDVRNNRQNTGISDEADY